MGRAGALARATKAVARAGGALNERTRRTLPGGPKVQVRSRSTHAPFVHEWTPRLLDGSAHACPSLDTTRSTLSPRAALPCKARAGASANARPASARSSALKKSEASMPARSAPAIKNSPSCNVRRKRADRHNNPNSGCKSHAAGTLNLPQIAASKTHQRNEPFVAARLQIQPFPGAAPACA
jgi:hypothetical protein